MRSLRKIIVWESCASDDDKLKAYSCLPLKKFSRKDHLINTEKYKNESFREEREMPPTQLPFPSPRGK